jgi:hypothetical protein
VESENGPKVGCATVVSGSLRNPVLSDVRMRGDYNSGRYTSATVSDRDSDANSDSDSDSESNSDPGPDAVAKALALSHSLSLAGSVAIAGGKSFHLRHSRL